MRLAVIIPDRNDRPLFLDNCLKMIDSQTMQPDKVLIMNEPAIYPDCDITWRYRKAYEKVKDYDLILLMENDDWYSPKYIETMVNQYLSKLADIIGTSYTIYYHVGIRKWLKLTHPNRSSAMSTMLRGGLTIDWGHDEFAYTDLTLWQQLKGYTFEPKQVICLGIKHGTTITGGRFHNDRLDSYTNDDFDLVWLENHVGELVEFYAKYKR